MTLSPATGMESASAGTGLDRVLAAMGAGTGSQVTGSAVPGIVKSLHAQWLQAMNLAAGTQAAEESQTDFGQPVQNSPALLGFQFSLTSTKAEERGTVPGNGGTQRSSLLWGAKASLVNQSLSTEALATSATADSAQSVCMPIALKPAKETEESANQKSASGTKHSREAHGASVSQAGSTDAAAPVMIAANPVDPAAVTLPTVVVHPAALAAQASVRSQFAAEGRTAEVLAGAGQSNAKQRDAQGLTPAATVSEFQPTAGSQQTEIAATSLSTGEHSAGLPGMMAGNGAEREAVVSRAADQGAAEGKSVADSGADEALRLAAQAQAQSDEAASAASQTQPAGTKAKLAADVRAQRIVEIAPASRQDARNATAAEISGSAVVQIPAETRGAANPLTAGLSASSHALAPDPFAALNADSSTGPVHWTQTGAQHAEAGFADPALGWVAVRADLHNSGVHATVVASSADSAATLGGELAGLNAHLAERQVPVASVTVAAAAGSDSTLNNAMQQGSAQGNGRDGNEKSAPANLSPVAGTDSRSRELPGAISSAAAPLARIATGIHISVLA